MGAGQVDGYGPGEFDFAARHLRGAGMRHGRRPRPCRQRVVC
jgi:hypothetical protein